MNDRCKPLRSGDRAIPDGMPGRWYRVLGQLCRVRYSRREKTYHATVYECADVGYSVVGIFKSANDAAEGAAQMIELRGVGRLVKISEIGKAK